MLYLEFLVPSVNKHFVELTASKHNLAASEIMSNPAPCLRNLSARERYVGMGRGIQHTAAGAMGEKNKRPEPEGLWSGNIPTPPGTFSSRSGRLTPQGTWLRRFSHGTKTSRDTRHELSPSSSPHQGTLAHVPIRSAVPGRYSINLQAGWIRHMSKPLQTKHDNQLDRQLARETCNLDPGRDR